jgi:hypothetical protein
MGLEMRRLVRLAAQSRIAGAGMGFLRVFCLAQKWTSAHEYVIDYMNFTASVSSVKQKDGRQAILRRRDRNEALTAGADRYGDACDGKHIAEWLMNSIGTSRA